MKVHKIEAFSILRNYYILIYISRTTCRSGFTTLPPVLLQEQPAVVLLLERALVFLVASYR
jgi:hypothetical protein